MREISSGTLLLLMLLFMIAEISPSYSVTIPIVEVISVETGKTTFNTWNSSSYFYKNGALCAKVTVRNNDDVSRTATIYVNAFDELSQPFGNYVGNVTLLANETKIIYTRIYVPTWAYSGNGRVTAFAITLPEGTFCPEKTSFFYLSKGKASYLRLETSGLDGFNVSVWIDGDSGLTPTTVQLDPGFHALKIQAISPEWVEGVLYKYAFSVWENGSTSVFRGINVSMSMNQTIMAYYISQPWPLQPYHRAML